MAVILREPSPAHLPFHARRPELRDCGSRLSHIVMAARVGAAQARVEAGPPQVTKSVVCLRPLCS